MGDFHQTCLSIIDKRRNPGFDPGLFDSVERGNYFLIQSLLFPRLVVTLLVPVNAEQNMGDAVLFQIFQIFQIVEVGLSVSFKTGGFEPPTVGIKRYCVIPIAVDVAGQSEPAVAIF